MLALAESRPAPSPGARVPVEFVGQARQFLRRIDKAHEQYEAATELLIAPFRPRPGFKPVPRHAMLERLSINWRDYGGKTGRLRGQSTVRAGVLDMTELRCSPGRVRLAEWSDQGDDELAVSLVLRHVRIETCGVFFDQTRLIAMVGLHALSRRMQKSADRSVRATLEDLTVVAEHYKLIKNEDRDEFETRRRRAANGSDR
jgi:hypothetical protein